MRSIFICIDFSLLHPFVWRFLVLYTTHLRRVNSLVVSEKLATSILSLTQADTTKIKRGIQPPPPETKVSIHISIQCLTTEDLRCACNAYSECIGTFSDSCMRGKSKRSRQAHPVGHKEDLSRTSTIWCLQKHFAVKLLPSGLYTLHWLLRY